MEGLFEHVGHFGRFQAYAYFTSAFQAISCGIHYLASVFIAVTPNYVCRPPGNVSLVLLHNNTFSQINEVWDIWTSSKDYLAVQQENGDIWELHRCSRFKREGSFTPTYTYDGNKTVFACSDGYQYDHSHLESSIVTDWDLVCDHEWLAKLTQPTFMLGVLIGAVVFGDIADRVGRRPIMWITSSCQFIFGVAVAFTFNYYSFVITRFILAMVSSGYLVVVFVYVTEYVGSKFRTWASIHIHTFFAVGVMIVALVGYLVRTWWIYQLILSVITLPFIMCCWMLPETPFWLQSQRKCKEVERVIATMEKWNKVSTQFKLSELCPVEEGREPSETDAQPAKKHNLFDLFHSWTFARRTISVWLIWFTGSFGYYVFALNSVNLGGNEYFNLFLAGAVEIPSYIVCCFCMDKLGRRNTLAPFLLLSTVICIVIMVIPEDYNTITIVMSMAGKFSVGTAFGLIYLYTAELYPTPIRSLAVGSGSMICRVGSVVAPFCVYLTDVWIFMPQVLVGTLTLVTGILTLMLPETLGKPLLNTMEEAADTEEQEKMKKKPIEANGVVMEKLESSNADNSSESLMHRL
ncbi:solute carrier family 22 member 16 isoform X1 [Bufo gargarizans]|uniref:solute carrier family 22 member 16 isoform X1 n=1 Tax=Bufo gargarizans TaxID=30331 RepID=UPI001CF36B73|nr:solute carrier family 22 member 16 isoform X1 [Bufo gargarizans]